MESAQNKEGQRQKDSFQMVERALEACQLPVSRVCVENKMLRIHLNRAGMMKTFLPRVAREGLRYGANTLLKEVSKNKKNNRCVLAGAILFCCFICISITVLL